ncbi:uncharacterized protein METZ01_LOCUS7278 [marine metagenome]|uniref:Uncharacterized protein n=1 Tax=marine metagenome TaxID=408172 RepID=A0A381NJX9_9ZZZZ
MTFIEKIYEENKAILIIYIVETVYIY